MPPLYQKAICNIINTIQPQFTITAGPSFQSDTYGNLRWYDEQGRHHNDEGPAVRLADGTKYWFIHGKLHRIDGPAIICPDGLKLYYYQDQRIPCDSDEEWEQILKLKAFW